MTTISPEVTESLYQLLSSLTSADNQVRSAAERSLNQDWISGGQEKREVLLMTLAQQAVGGYDGTARSFSAVLFRTISLKQPDEQFTAACIIETVSAPVLNEIKQTLLQGFLAETQDKMVRHKIADAVSCIAKPMSWNKNLTWPELLPAMMEAVKSPTTGIRESAFRILSTVPEIIGESLVASSVPAFQAGFADADEVVRIAAVTAFTSFFEQLKKPAWPTLQQLLPQLLEVMMPLRQQNKGYELSSVLESVIDLAELAPKMFKPMFKHLIDFCVDVAKDKESDIKARLSALELATTFVDEAPNMCKREPSYAESMVMLCLQMMTEVGEDDDDAAEWNNEDDVMDSEDQDEAYSAAKQSLDRLALKLGGKIVLPPLFQWLPTMINSQQWRERHAALMALSNVAEGSRDVMMAELDKILDMVIPLLNDPHARVQWATCNALGQMSTDFADFMQRNYGNRVLPALISKLDNHSTFRVQSHAAAAMVNFSESASKEVLEPYLDDLLGRLVQLLESPKRYVQEQVLTTIAIVADAAESKFSKYYEPLMKMLFNVMRQDAGKELRLLKAKSIECATLIALAVGKEKFAPDCEAMVHLFAQIQASITDDDDPCQSYLVHAWGRLCRIIGTDFLPYLSGVMPPLLASAKHRPDIKLLDDENQVEELNQQDGWEILPIQGKYVGIHTSLLDEKSNAIDLLSVYASELGADFYPYVKEIVVDVIVPGLNFFYHDGVRYAAAAAAPHLLSCAQKAVARQNGGDMERAKQDPAVLELWVPILRAMLEVLPVDKMVEVLAGYYSNLYQCIEIIGRGALSASDMQSLVKSIEVNLTDYIERMASRNEDDDEYAEDVEEEDAEAADEELLGEMSKVINVTFKFNKSEFLLPFQTLMPILQAFLTSSSDDCRHWALCVIDDMIEYTGQDSFQFHEMFLSNMVDALVSGDASVRQAAAYGIGVAAQHGGAQYAQYTISALPTLFNLINVPEARSEDNVHATENASAAIAKILRTHGALVGDSLDQALTEWVKTLPIIADDEAAPFPYLFLSNLIEKSHASVTSQVPKVFESVAQALVHASISGKTAEHVVAATKQLLGTVPHNEAMALFQQLPAESQPVVQKWFL
ncbi:importin subunit beta-3 [Trichomonascus vanleenenianus]|uniref:importin PSE1 n=1 Tax=Trichomonascus vanleenenianus TaxID=2268995 RepID=UPI003ECB72B8